MVRAKIQLPTQGDIIKFISALDDDDTYSLIDSSQRHCVSARSLMGVIYASAEFDELYLVNETHDGMFPSGIDYFRKTGSK